MEKKLTIFFLIIESDFLFKNEFPKNFSSKNKENFFKEKIYNNTFIERILEQIKIFLNFQFFVNIDNKFHLILSYEKMKWTLPIKLKKKNTNLEQKLKFLSLMKIFLQEKKILKKENLIRKWIDKKKKNIIFYLNSVLYIVEKTIQHKIFCSFKIFNFIIKKSEFKHLIKAKNLIIASQKLGIIFDTFIVGEKDFVFFQNFSGKTGGIYCRPNKNLLKISFTEELIDVLISIFLSTIYLRQLHILPFSTKTLKQERLFNDKKKIYYLCSLCFSFFSNLPTSCYLCGVDFDSI
jgi:hypothetical protein